MYAGRRGEIAWEKAGFLGGGRRDYDTFPAFGLGGPIVLRPPLHTFGWGRTGFTARAIPLREDRRFRIRAYIGDWFGLLAFFSAIATPALAAAGFVRNLDGQANGGLFYLLASLAFILFGCCVGMLYGHHLDDRRHRAIRLILGPHAWGSSDPAYWRGDLLSGLVRPEKAFGVGSYGELAERAIDERRWARAMWAARLCRATEDAALGEELTEEILRAGEVRAKLGEVMRDPRQRDRAFGKPIPLTTWMRGDLDSKVSVVEAERLRGWN